MSYYSLYYCLNIFELIMRRNPFPWHFPVLLFIERNNISDVIKNTSLLYNYSEYLFTHKSINIYNS